MGPDVFKGVEETGVTTTTDYKPTPLTEIQSQRHIVFIGVRDRLSVLKDVMPRAAPLRFRPERDSARGPNAIDDFNRRIVKVQVDRICQSLALDRRPPTHQSFRILTISNPENARMSIDRCRRRQERKQRFQPTCMIVVPVTQHNGVQGRRIEVQRVQIVQQNVSTSAGVK
jgi:hypothetical protein